MKAINELYQEGLDGFCENGFWKGIYDAAPEGAKESLELQFYVSALAEKGVSVSPGEVMSFPRITRMKKSDWKYLLPFARHPAQRAYYERHLAEITEAEQGEGGRNER